MSLAAMLARSKQLAAQGAAAPAAPAAPAVLAASVAPVVPALLAAAPAAIAATAAPLSSDNAALVAQFRKSLDHLTAALADPKYAIPVADAVRDVGMTIREHPHLNALIEPQDFANLVRVITESAQYKARNAAETKNARAVKAGAKADLAAAFDASFSLDGLSGGDDFDAPAAVKPAKAPAQITPPEKLAGINLAALLAKKKG